MNVLERCFHLEAMNTTAKREMLAGLTTFMAMSYILFVNPDILSAAGMDKGAVFVATALTALVGCLIMAFFANWPVGIAPAMGDNAFFAFSVVIGMHILWPTALAAVFIAAVLFAILTATRVRAMIIDDIPHDLKLAMAAGVGLFIAFIGLQGGGIIVKDPATLVALGPIAGKTWITVFGFLVTIVLVLRKVPGAIFIGMILTAIFAAIFGWVPVPHHIVSSIPSLKPIFAVSLGHLAEVHTLRLWSIVLMFLIIAFFDTTGTLVGLGEQAGFSKNNKIPGMGKALGADSGAMVVGTILGSTPASAYIESSTGIAVGGRTGLTALTIAVLFFLSLFFSPLLSVITGYVTAPILVVVGVLMASTLKDIDWKRFEIAVPAFLTVLVMPLTFNIAYGIGFGLVTYPVTMIAAGKGRQVTPLMYVLAAVFILLFGLFSTVGR
ncbi:MAG TPA: NCS2 family permease [Nevskiaceae bacterium]|nr:NCS2 family permease [Nevskiaceae bacterium]